MTRVQSLLNRVVTPSPNLPVDGNFGPGTARAVVAFQSSQGIGADGVVGPDTWRRLLAADPAEQAPTEPSAPEAPPAPSPSTGAPSPDSKAGGLLVAAFQDSRLDEITWVDVTVNDIVVTVASDAVKAPLGDVTGVRLPLSYAETIDVCKAMGCVTPSLLICEAMLKQAKAQLLAVGLVMTPEDSLRMANVEFVLAFHTRVEAQIASHHAGPGDLLFGAWKLWILHQRLADPTVPQLPAINFGFWDGRSGSRTWAASTTPRTTTTPSSSSP